MFPERNFQKFIPIEEQKLKLWDTLNSRCVRVCVFTIENSIVVTFKYTMALTTDSLSPEVFCDNWGKIEMHMSYIEPASRKRAAYHLGEKQAFALRMLN